MSPQTKKWLTDIAGQFIEGCSDGFLAIMGGSTALQTTGRPPVELVHLLCSMLALAGIYVASYLKKTRTPADVVLPVPAPVVPVPAT